MVILPEKVEEFKQQLGAKTLNLKKLKDLELNVPNFLALPAAIIELLWEEKNKANTVQLSNLVNEVADVLPCKKYAVRSSALVEDSLHNSYAGQFLTKLDIGKAELSGAILEVIGDAYKKLGGSLSQFSIIIQEYIDPDYSGVAFTRNPQNGREMVVEYHKGTGEEVVGGQILPKRLEFYWSEAVASNELPLLSQAIQNFKLIENSFKAPQDIEWCIRGNIFYYLQSRPITTLPSGAYEEFMYLDSVLPKNKKFIFEKTKISEIAPRPTPFTFSLLQKIYSQNGPVDKVYRKYGISYKTQNILQLIGNELYIDREEEIKTLLPCFSYLNDSYFQPKFSSFWGMLSTIKNIFKLNLLPLDYSGLAETIKIKLNQRQAAPSSLTEAIEIFLKDYEIIFEINLLAEKALKRLQATIKGQGLNVSTLLSFPVDSAWAGFEMKDSQKLQGNSLEIYDYSKFMNRLEKISDSGSMDALSGVPKWKRDHFKSVVEQAQVFNRLREYGRWLTVKNINMLRNTLFTISGELKFSRQDNIFFFSIPELNAEGNSEQLGNNRRLEYEKYDKFNLPPILTSSVRQQSTDSKVFGVSPGVAKGVLLPADSIKIHPNPILYTRILSPDLVQYFPDIKGIVSEKGGLLSHLAIMARENNIPVIVNFSLAKSKIHLGDEIILDADLGDVRPLGKGNS